MANKQRSLHYHDLGFRGHVTDSILNENVAK